MNILGVSGLYFDAAAVLVQDGVVRGAAMEERFTRIAHDPALPLRATRHLLEEAGLTAGDLDWLVFYEKPLRRFLRVLSNSVSTFPAGWRGFPSTMRDWLGDRLWVRNELSRAFGVPAEKILFCEHQLAHAASAFFPSPHASAAILVLDGLGETASTTLWRGVDHTIEGLAEVALPHSLALFTGAVGAWAGLPFRAGERAFADLAGLGAPSHRDEIDRILQVKDGFSLDLDYVDWHRHPTRPWSDRFEAVFGAPRAPGAPLDVTRPADRRYADVVASTQSAVEDAVLALATDAKARTGADTLCLAGDLAANPLVVRRLGLEGPFTDVWVQPAMTDAGGALGAALWAWHVVEGRSREAHSTSTELGRGFSPDSVGEVLTDLRLSASPDRLVDDLLDGRLVAVFSGRDPWGARTTGGRSILADPRRPELRERLLSLKGWEPFRTIPVAVRAEDCGDWFDLPESTIEPANRTLVAADVQRDSLGQLAGVPPQGRLTPHRVEDGVLHPILTAFGEATGVPLLLHTALRLPGEPMASTPVDAVAALLRSEIDVLYLEGHRVERRVPWSGSTDPV